MFLSGTGKDAYEGLAVHLHFKQGQAGHGPIEHDVNQSATVDAWASEHDHSPIAKSMYVKPKSYFPFAHLQATGGGSAGRGSPYLIHGMTSEVWVSPGIQHKNMLVAPSNLVLRKAAVRIPRLFVR
jgi:hypothetical protein